MFSYYAITKNGERIQFSAMYTSEAIDRCRRNGWTFAGVVQESTGYQLSNRH